MSTSRASSRRVHYESGTKEGRSHRSRDSGVGSSSASDRASLGTFADESSFATEQQDAQRRNLHVVQEALDAANEKIRSLESKVQKLDASLRESNEERRLLKREKKDLIEANDQLGATLDAERKLNERLKRESSPRTREGPSTSNSSSRRATPPTMTTTLPSHPAPRGILRNPAQTTTYPERERERDREREPFSPSLSHPVTPTIPNTRERRASTAWRENPFPHPIHPQTYEYSSPLDPNPFLPHSPHPSTPRSLPSMAYPLASAGTPAYAPIPSRVPYASAPYTSPPYDSVPLARERDSPPNDGKYHLSPV